VGISPKDGALLWKQEYPGKTAVIPTPIVKDNQVYVTAGYGVGSMSFIVQPDNTLRMVFDETSSTGKVMKNHHGGVILVNGLSLRLQRWPRLDLPGLEDGRRRLE
jgi:hypothetical protein